MKLILASTSKNRQALLNKMSIKFESISPNYEEVIDESLAPQKQVQLFAKEKAKSVYKNLNNKLDDILILGFDSMVDFENTSIGKQDTKENAFKVLQKFRGKSQKIVSGISCIGNWQGQYFEQTEFEETHIKFRDNLTDKEIKSYLDFEDWSGKCGAYSILGTGIFMLEEITGDFQNIIGIPVFKMGKMIQEITGKSPLEIFEKKEKSDELGQLYDNLENTKGTKIEEFLYQYFKDIIKIKNVIFDRKKLLQKMKKK
jgi:septum formation protein